MFEDLNKVFEQLKANAEKQQQDIINTQNDVKNLEAEIISALEQIELVNALLKQLRENLSCLNDDYQLQLSNIKENKLMKTITTDEELQKKLNVIFKNKSKSNNEEKYNELILARNQLMESKTPLRKRMEELSIKKAKGGLSLDEEAERDNLFREIKEQNSALEEINNEIDKLEKKLKF